VDGFEERGAAGMNVGGGGARPSPPASCAARSLMMSPKKIVGDDDVELARVADEFHGERVDVEMAGVDVGIFGADGLEDALPQVAGVGHGVGFVGHAEAF